MATRVAMAASSTSMGRRFCHAARTPLRTAAPSAEWEGRLLAKLGLEGLPTAAGLLGVGIRDPETGPAQPVLVIDDRSGEVNQSAVLDKKLHAVRGKGFVARFAGGNFHGVRHAGASARFDVNAESLALG